MQPVLHRLAGMDGMWRVVGCLIWLWASAAIAQPMLAVPGDAGWAVTDSGCHVWNPLGSANESVRWTGKCVDGRASGDGTLVWRAGDKPAGVYLGHMELGRLNGRGTFLFGNGDRYEGTFRDDRLEGYGELQTRSGNRYRGEFVNFRMSGQGIFTFANGDRFEGRFANDLPNGPGRVLWANGERFDGTFRDGIPDGPGTYISSSQTYTGQWVQGCFKDGNRRRAVLVPPTSCP